MYIYYSDVIMSLMASQITGVSILYSTVCSGEDQGKHRVTGEFPSQGVSNVKNVSIWWRLHVKYCYTIDCPVYLLIASTILIALACL